MLPGNYLRYVARGAEPEPGRDEGVMQRRIDRVRAAYADNLPRGTSLPGPRGTWTPRQGREIATSQVVEDAVAAIVMRRRAALSAKARCPPGRARSAITMRAHPVSI